MKKAILIFSGGPDSTAAILWALSEGYELTLLSFEFKQNRNVGELKCAKEIAAHFNLCHIIVDLKCILEHFDDNMHILMHAGTKNETSNKKIPHLMPYGAGFILTYTCSFAIYNEFDTIIWGANKSDSFNSREYTQHFADSLSNLITSTTNKEIKILVPFSEIHKPQVLELFSENSELFSLTWSCKNPNFETEQCGECTACRARRISARMAKLSDMSIYTAQEFKHDFSESEIDNYKTLSHERLSLFGSEVIPIPWK